MNLKHLPVIFTTLVCVANASAQEEYSYAELLSKTIELNVDDSLNVKDLEHNMSTIDSATAAKWFSNVFSTSTTGKLKNRNFYIAGKITTDNYFDLLLLAEEKKKDDTTTLQIFYLVTTRKDGACIASFKAALNGMSKRVNYNVSSCLYKNFKIIQDSKISFPHESISDLTEYMITGKGKFIAYARN
jgi:hypothetical protein